MAKLTHAQTELLAAVEQAQKSYKEARAYEHKRARDEADRRIASFRSNVDVTVRAAFEGGIPKLRIGLDGLGTKNPHAVYDSLARTQESAEAITATQALLPKIPERYTLTPATATKPAVLTLTLDPNGEELAKHARDKAPAEIVAAGQHVAHFPITPTGATGMPLDPKKDWAHPLFLYFTGTDIQREADAWLAENYAVPAPAPTSAPATPTYELDDEDLAA